MDKKWTALLSAGFLALGLMLGLFGARHWPGASFDVFARADTQPGTLLDPAQAEDGAVSDTPDLGKIPVNSAGAELLTELPGIGPTLARRVVAYREANGPFRSVSELMLVEGIGEELLAGIRPYITLD